MAEDRWWAAQIIHALDPHRGGYSWQSMDRLRLLARNVNGEYLSDEEAARIVESGPGSEGE